MSEVDIIIGADTTQMEKAIQNALSQDFKLKSLNTKSISRSLGTIKGDLGEFEKSLEASNARVVAFGASAGSVYLLTDAFKSVVSSTIEVEKSLADINSVLNANEKDIKTFGNTLFDVANKTSSSFDVASQAALEFSRQGLSLQETIKRTTDALTLAKLSGLSAADSVDALTAAVNSFNNSGLTSSQIVNKLAAVDAKYAVSSADLAEAIKRVGSSAKDAGVNIDQLIGLVTSAQQTTARGGSVIGNSFKTIFTRLQRPKVLEDLKEIGIQTTNSYGETLPLIQILTQLASTYDKLGSSQRSQIAELIGGVYQVNILKATLGDLSKQYSIYNGALNTSASATNEAQTRIGKLGETLDSQINRVTNNIKRAGSVVGELTLAPALERVLTGANAVLETFALGKEPEGFGEKAAQGFLKGLGTFISGPGLVIAAVGAYKIFQRLAVFIGDAARTILTLGGAAQQQAQIQAEILQLLQRNPDLYKQIQSGAISVESAAAGYLKIVQATNAELERQSQLSAKIANIAMVGGAKVSPRGKVTVAGKNKASGYLPNFAGGVSASDKIREISAAANHKSGYSIGANDVYKTTIHDGNGGRQQAIVNRKEKVKTVRNAAGFLATSVIPPNGFAVGYLSNFAKGERVTKGISSKTLFKSGYGRMRGISNPNVQPLDISVLTNKIQTNYQPVNGRTPDQYETDVLKNYNKLGYQDNKILKFGSRSSVDGWKISNGVLDLLEVKSGGWNFLDVRRKFERMPFENADGISSPFFTPLNGDRVKIKGTLIQGSQPNFAGGLSLSQYALNKGKTIQGLKAPALNAAFEAGVSEREIKSAFPNWSYKGATTALKESRIAAAQERRTAYVEKYNFRKVKLGWDKKLSDFGGDTNLMGDAYEAFARQRFGTGDRQGRFYSGVELGLHGSVTGKDKNFTDVDFVLFKRKVNINDPKDVRKALSNDVSLLIEAKSGEYTPGEVSEKFPRTYKNNPFMRKNQNVKNLLISTYAGGFLPNFARGRGRDPKTGRFTKLKHRLASPGSATFTPTPNPVIGKPSLSLASRYTPQELSYIAASQANVPSQYLVNKPSIPQPSLPESPYVAPSPFKIARGVTKKKEPFVENLTLSQRFKSFLGVKSSTKTALPQAAPIAQPKLSLLTRPEVPPIESPIARSKAPTTTNLTARQRLQRAKESGKTLLGGKGPSKIVGGAGGGAGGGAEGGAKGPSWKGLGASLAFSYAPQALETLGAPLRNKETGELTSLGKAVDIGSTVGSYASTFGMLPKVPAKISKGIDRSLKPFNKFGNSIERLAKQVPVMNKIAPALGKITKRIPYLGAAVAGYQAFTGMQEKKKYGADTYESFVLEGLPAIANLVGGIGGGALGSLFGPLGTMLGAGSGAYAAGKMEKYLAEKAVGKTRLDQLKSNEDLAKTLEEDKRKYKGNEVAQLGIQFREAKGMTLSQGYFEGDDAFAKKIKQASDEALQARNAQVAQVIASIGQFDMQKLQETGATREDVSKLLEKKNIQTAGTKESVVSGVLGAISEGRKAEEAGRRMQYLNTVLSTLTAQAGYTAAILDRVKEKEKERTKLMSQNLGGGVSGFEKPSEVNDSLIKIRESLDILNDPRLNIIDKGRAARRYKEGLSEMGVYESLPEQKRRRIEALQTAGLQASNAQNLYQLNRMTFGGGFGSDIYGATYGKNGAINAARQQAGLTRLTSAEYQLSQSDSSYYTSEDFRVKSLNKTQRESLTGSENKLRNFADFLNRLNQASINSPVAKNYLENQVMPMVSNAQGNNEFSRTGNINETIAAFNKIIESLPADVSKALDKVNENSINVNTNVLIDFTKDAKDWIEQAKKIREEQDKEGKKKSKTPPKKMD